MERIYTLDMHTHTLEKNLKPMAYWKRVLEVGLDGTAITEHAEIGPKKAYKELVEKKPKNIMLIPGVEINTNMGHVLAFADDDWLYDIPGFLKKNVKLQEVIDTAKQEKVVLSVAHPWGFSYDSIAYLHGVENLEDLMKKEDIGVEVYNGMMGYLNDFVYGSNWIKKPLNFFQFLERNRVARKTGLARAGNKLKKKMSSKTLEVINRCYSALELGERAKFVTAGSDAHSAQRIGAGIIKLKSEKEDLDNKGFLEELKKKDNVIWSGPLVKEVRKGMFEKVDDPLSRKEMFQGVKYAAKKYVERKKIKKRIRKKLKRKGKKGQSQ